MSQSSVRLLCALCIVAVAAAQTPTGMIVGSITDSSGASVHGARIELTHEQTGLVRKTNSDVVGSFRIPDLPVGSYALSVEAQGFKKYQQNSILVTVSRNVT